MNLLEYFEDEYSKVQKAHGSITAAFLQAKDLSESLTSAYKKLSEIKPDIENISSIESEKLEELLSSMNNFIRECNSFAYDINIAVDSIKNLKED